MTAEAITIVSGLTLLVVFVLVGWNLRRNGLRRADRREESKP